MALWNETKGVLYAVHYDRSRLAQNYSFGKQNLQKNARYSSKESGWSNIFFNFINRGSIEWGESLSLLCTFENAICIQNLALFRFSRKRA